VIPGKLDERLSSAGPFLDSLKRTVEATLRAYADDHNFPISGRIKSAASVAEKIEMGRYQRFSEIDDLVAFTMIIPSAKCEDEVTKFCKRLFDVTEIRGKSTTQKAPDVFRFDSTRVVARVRRSPDLAGSTRPSISDYLFEIQVRTAFEHAWSVATHDLVYKGSSIDWKRARLAAQLKATSEGLDAAVAAFEYLADAIEESPWDRFRGQVDVSQYIADAFEGQKLPSTLKPSSVSRFSQNFCALIQAIRPTLSVSDALEVITDELRQMSSVPVSLSLYQLFLGMLCHGRETTEIKTIRCHVTNELATLFPETRKLEAIFDYDS
jgi:ppGpp synthetase/RelA/SpoT-type nucleotidyltranferase